MDKMESMYIQFYGHETSLVPYVLVGMLNIGGSKQNFLVVSLIADYMPTNEKKILESRDIVCLNLWKIGRDEHFYWLMNSE